MVKVTSPEEFGRLNAEIERLQKALATERGLRTEAEDAAKKAAEAQGTQGFVLQSGMMEVPTGELIKVKRLKEYKIRGYTDDRRPIYEPVFHDVEVPTYFYKIDLPASGGEGINIGGNWFYHGQSYKMDLDLLRTMKDIVHRSWVHEGNIKGNNENVFRKPENRTLRGARA